MLEFIHGASAVFVRPLDPREGNEWKYIGEATTIEISASADLHNCNLHGHELVQVGDTEFYECIHCKAVVSD